MELPLWKRVIEARYGSYEAWMDVESQTRNIKKSSLWWRDLVLLGEGTRMGIGWFKEIVKKKMGDGAMTKFWFDDWVGTESLARIFPSLFNNCNQKEATVMEMGQWRQNTWNWDMSWTETLPASEAGNIAVLTEFLQGIEPNRNVADKWIWQPDTVGGYTVKECYKWIMRKLSHGQAQNNNIIDACKRLWKNDLPSKLLIFCWRLLWNKLPTRDKLHNRGILLSPNELRCVFCGSDTETAEHIFGHCDFAQEIWKCMLAWLNANSNIEGGIMEIFTEMGGLFKGKQVKRSKNIIWAAAVWGIWMTRNNVIFRGNNANVSTTVSFIKYTSWGWFISRRGRNSGLNFSDWFHSPMGCIHSL